MAAHSLHTGEAAGLGEGAPSLPCPGAGPAAPRRRAPDPGRPPRRLRSPEPRRWRDARRHCPAPDVTAGGHQSAGRLGERGAGDLRASGRDWEKEPQALRRVWGRGGGWHGESRRRRADGPRYFGEPPRKPRSERASVAAEALPGRPPAMGPKAADFTGGFLPVITKKKNHPTQPQVRPDSFTALIYGRNPGQVQPPGGAG